MSKETKAEERARRKYRSSLRGKEMMRRAWMRSIYGLTVKDYTRLKKRQNGRCGICYRKKCGSGRHLSIDHNHATMKIRGLLCMRCNRALGWYDLYHEGIKEYLAQDTGEYVCPKRVTSHAIQN